APVKQTTLLPPAKTLELMRQLEALAQEVTLASRGDTSDQCTKIQEGSDFSAGLKLVEPSILLSQCDQLASDSPSFGTRTDLTLGVFFTTPRNRLGSYRPSFGKPSATLASSFITARDWLASSRLSFGGPSALAGFFTVTRDRVESLSRSFGRRTS